MDSYREFSISAIIHKFESKVEPYISEKLSNMFENFSEMSGSSLSISAIIHKLESKVELYIFEKFSKMCSVM